MDAHLLANRVPSDNVRRHDAEACRRSDAYRKPRIRNGSHDHALPRAKGSELRATAVTLRCEAAKESLRR